MFETRDVELLLQVARDAAAGGTFERRFEAITPTLARLVPSLAMTAVVVKRTLDGPPAEPRAFVRGLAPADVAEYATRYVEHDPCPRAAQAQPGVPSTLSDHVPAHRFGRDPYTGELLTRHGIRHVVGCLVPVPDGWLSLGLHRERGRRDFKRREREVLRLLAPDLGRAAFNSLLAEKVARLTGAVDGPGGEGEGALLFDARGDLVHVDPRARGLVRQLAPGHGLPPDELLDDVRQLLSAGAGPVRQRVLSAADGGAVVARSTRVDLEPHAVVLTLLAPVAPVERKLRALARRWGLTERELEVARLAAEGLRNASIAEALRVAPPTVNVHLGRVFRKAGVSGRAELIRRLTDPDER